MRYEKDADIYLTPNRAYSPALGRWLSADPLGTLPNPKQGNRFAPLDQYTDGQNLYEYCAGDPVNKRDLWGLFWAEWLFFWEFVDHWESANGSLFTYGGDVVAKQAETKLAIYSYLPEIIKGFCNKFKHNKHSFSGKIYERTGTVTLTQPRMSDTLGTGYRIMIIGDVNVSGDRCTCIADTDITYTWVDIGDLNSSNKADRLLATIRSLMPAYHLGYGYQDFPIRIPWKANNYFEWDYSGSIRVKEGWPYE